MSTRRNITKTSCRAIAKQFKTRTEFAHGDYHAYKVALKNGWLDDYTWFTNQPGHDRDACFNLAKDCKSRSEYAKKHPGAYLHALKNNWISDYTWFAIPKPKCITYDMCNSMAMSCKTQKEFRDKYPSAYQKAVSNGWFSKFTWLTLTRGPKLTYDVCLKYAKKCKSMADFWKTYKTAAAKAAQMKWSNDWTWLVRQHETKLTRAKCYELAKDCHTLKELKKAHPGVLSRAKKEGWIIDYTWLVSGRIKHTYKICWETAKKYKTKSEFRKNDRNIYDAAYKNGWLPDYTWLKRAAIIEKRTTDNVYAYEFKRQHAVYVGRTVNLTQRDQSHHGDKSTVSRFAKRNKIAIPRMKILVRGVTITEGLVKEDLWVQRYKSKGWTILNIAKTGMVSGSLGTLGRVRLTKIHCETEARKYTTLRDFSTNAPHEYQKACRTGWIEQYSWLARERLPQNTWNKDTCFLEAKKYNTIKQFKTASPVAYTTACANKWIGSYTWLSRLKTPNGTWSKASFQKIADAAKNYVSRSDFLTHAKAAYRRAKETGWIDVLFPLDAKVTSLASNQTSTV